MPSAPRITLEQWRALQAVVEAGGYAQAAAQLHKSQSTVTYAVQKIERLLDVRVFEMRGRKAALTDAGQVLYRRARTLLEEAAMLERGAAAMAEDWQPEIRIAVEILFPTWLLLECLAEFASERPETRIEVYETVLAGTGEMLADGRVDFAIGSDQGGVTGDPLMNVSIVAAAHPAHPLHRLGRPLTQRDLRHHRRILIRESGVQRKFEAPGGAEVRWTVSHKATQIRAVSMGLGYAFLSEETIREELGAGTLKPLPLPRGRFTGQLFLAFYDPEFPGRDAARLADIIRTRTAEACRKRAASGNPSARARASPRSR
jgi:DNA-binding transcriptional LysR family regulator